MKLLNNRNWNGEQSQLPLVKLKRFKNSANPKANSHGEVNMT